MGHLLSWLVPILVFVYIVYLWLTFDNLLAECSFMYPVGGWKGRSGDRSVADILPVVQPPFTVGFQSLHGRAVRELIIKHVLRPAQAETAISPGHWTLQADRQTP